MAGAAAPFPDVETLPRARSGARPTVSVIVAAETASGGIGRDGKLPWSIPSDMAFFRRLSTHTSDASKKNAVVMGRRTWASIPERFRPLKGRVNVVLSRGDPERVREEDGIPEGVLVYKSLREAISALSEGSPAGALEAIHIMGGSSAFAEAINECLADVLYITEVRGPAGEGTAGDDPFGCDVRIPWPINAEAYQRSFEHTPAEDGGVAFQFVAYVRKEGAGAAGGGAATVGAAAAAGTGEPASASLFREPHRSSRPFATGAAAPPHEELQYLEIVRDIIENGVRRGDRTGTGTLSKFGVTMRFSLREDTLPLLTTKRVFWRGVAEELFWFIAGDTSAKTLQDKGIHIWDGNASREFLDSRGLHDREEGDLGPVYGFQWRHFGAEYTDMHADYAGKGVDQLATVIETIRTNPTDRRIVISAWNPAALPDMALPPCHMFAQFFVADGELSCQMYQRSADMGLGVPFNIASYALLTRLIAHVTGLRAAEFVHVIGDAHVYLNHVDALREQLERSPRPFPKLFIDKETTDIEAISFEDLRVEGYTPHKSIKMKMAV